MGKKCQKVVKKLEKVGKSGQKWEQVVKSSEK